MTSLCDLSASRLAREISRKEVSAAEVVRAFLERIGSLDPKLGCYLWVDEKRAIACADDVDGRIRAGEKLGPLAGVPIGLKDIFVTRGIPTTCASKILQGWTPPYEGTPSQRLKDAGAILLGKLNMDEFAMGSSTENSGIKATRNPWNPEYVPGGSSGGSAAAVAAGLCAASLGTDTGGSIRQPASLCGIVGLKPTYGRVSRYGVIAFASSLDQVGPMCGSVEDTALLLEVIAGHDPLDSTSIDAPVPRYRDALDKGIQGLRLGIPKEYFIPGMDPDVEQSVRAAIAKLESLGARTIEVSLPHTEYAIATYYLLCTAEASSNLARYDGVRYGHRTAGATGLLDMYRRTRSEGFGPEVKRRIMLGTYVLCAGYYDAYYAKAQRVRTLIRRDFEQAFEKCDAIVTPTSPIDGFRLGEKTGDPLSMYLADIFTISCNLAGLPGLSMPCGFSGKRLPIGLQLLGKPLGEETLFRIGGAYEAATEWHKRRPPLGQV